MTVKTQAAVQPDQVSRLDSGHGSADSHAPAERIVQVARELFCRHGIHATGIDRILAAAGASKMALYNRFGSKEGLVREVLAREGADWRRAYFAAIDQATTAGSSPLAHVIDGVAAMFARGDFYGCAFMNAIAEHTKGEAWLRDLAAEHHRAILGQLTHHATAGGYPGPALVARQLLLLLDGTIAALMVTGDPSVLDIARRTQEAVLRRD